MHGLPELPRLQLVLEAGREVLGVPVMLRLAICAALLEVAWCGGTEPAAQAPTPAASFTAAKTAEAIATLGEFERAKAHAVEIAKRHWVSPAVSADAMVRARMEGLRGDLAIEGWDATWEPVAAHWVASYCWTVDRTPTRCFYWEVDESAGVVRSVTNNKPMMKRLGLK